VYTYYVIRVPAWLGNRAGDRTKVVSKLPDDADEYYTIRAASIAEARKKHEGKRRLYPMSQY